MKDLTFHNFFLPLHLLYLSISSKVLFILQRNLDLNSLWISCQNVHNILALPDKVWAKYFLLAFYQKSKFCPTFFLFIYKDVLLATLDSFPPTGRHKGNLALVPHQLPHCFLVLKFQIINAFFRLVLRLNWFLSCLLILKCSIFMSSLSTY